MGQGKMEQGEGVFGCSLNFVDSNTIQLLRPQLCYVLPFVPIRHVELTTIFSPASGGRRKEKTTTIMVTRQGRMMPHLCTNKSGHTVSVSCQLGKYYVEWLFRPSVKTAITLSANCSTEQLLVSSPVSQSFVFLHILPHTKSLFGGEVFEHHFVSFFLN